MLIVIGIIAIVAAFVVPALGPASGRNLDGATRQFMADLDNARLIAIAERTRTRILLPKSISDFSGAASSPAPWPADIALRGYLITSSKRTDTVWKQRGKWNVLPQGIALDPAVGLFVQPAPSPVPTPIGVNVGGSGVATFEFNGPYIEFLPNGSSSLDPSASPAPAATLADAYVDSTGIFVRKNKNLKSTVTVDPLSGSVSMK